MKDSTSQCWLCFRLFLWRTQIICGYNFVALLSNFRREEILCIKGIFIVFYVNADLCHNLFGISFADEAISAFFRPLVVARRVL